MKNILVVGSINMDLTIHTERIPAVGETITGDSFCVSPGGKGSNQAIAAARLGGNVKFFGAVGNDMYGETLVNNLKRNNVDFCGQAFDGVSTGVAMITVCGGNNSIIIEKGANGALTNDFVMSNKSLFEWADYVVMQAEIPEDVILKSAKLAKENGAKVIFNPAPYKDFADELYKYVDIIVPNETETELMTGINPYNDAKAGEAVEAIRKKGVSDVIITLGERGALYNIGGESNFVPSIKVKAVDTTAAGDCFIGAFTKMLAAGGTADEAVKYAVKASSIAVSRYGASDSLPTEEDMK